MPLDLFALTSDAPSVPTASIEMSLEGFGKPKPKLPAEEAHAPAMARGARCRDCPMYGCGQGPVMPEIVPGAVMLVVGEAPGRQEVEAGAPFTGASGIVLNKALQQGGLDRSQVSVSNTICCRPPQNKSMHDFVLSLKKSHKRKIDRAKAAAKAAGQKFDKSSVPTLILPTDYCRPRLDADLLQTAPNTILAVGGMALQIVSGLLGLAHGNQKVRSGQTHVAVISKQHGAPVLLDASKLPEDKRGVKVLMSSYHPAFAMRGSREMMPIIESEIAKAARIACRGGAIDWKEPDFIVSPSIDEAINALDRLREWSLRTDQPVMVDIETDSKYPHLAKLRCVGVGGLGAGVGGTDLVVCIPVRNINRTEYWKNPADKIRVMRALHSLLNECKLAFQNGTYDLNVLFRVGLATGDRNRQWDDTLLCHHDSDWSELPHDLGFMMSQFLEAPHHKDDADVKVVENASDYDLRLYNCLAEGTPVECADGVHRTIDEIVCHREAVDVLSQNPTTGAIEPKPVMAWHKLRVPGQKWLCVKHDLLRGNQLGLVLTPDHRIYTQRGLLRADALHAGDTMFLAEEQLSAEQRQAVLGTLLGDTTLTTIPDNRKTRQESRSGGVAGGHVSEELVEHKIAVLAPHAQAAPTIKRDESRQDFYRFVLPQLRQLREMHALFYDGNRQRRLRREVLEQLGPIGLAWWFMDDGCRQNGQLNRRSNASCLRYRDGVVLAAQRYPPEDVVMAADWFRTHFGSASAGKDGAIRLSVRAAEKFAEYVAPYVIPAMRYKLPSHLRDALPALRTIQPSACQPITATVTSIEPHVQRKRIDRAETRYCLTVADNHNFFTNVGLVANCKDVLGQMRLLPILFDRTVASGQLDAYRTDQTLAPVARDMETLGIRVNQEKRIEHFLSQHARAEERLKLLRTVTGREDFNPGSVYHVRDWLYEDLKLTPPFSTDGTEWDDVLKLQADQEAEMAQEGEEIDDPDEIPWAKDPATSEGALQALISAGVPKDVERALNALIEYRGAKKLIGTYCGLRPVNDEKKLLEAKKKGRRTYTVQFEDKPLVVVDTSQIVWESTPWGLLPFIHPRWNIGTVVTGRWSCNPNLQAVPEQPLNMRALYETVPGHVMVGADASQIELRLYTLFSGDKLLWPMFLDPKEDPHSFNFASMAVGHKGEAAIQTFYADMKAKRLAAKKAGGKDKVIELLRTIAKRFCVAEGEPVLVRRGQETLEVPIETVKLTDEVWDGVEWVRHDGVVCNGVREVIKHDGLWATEDHEVWLATGEKVTFGEATRRGAALARSGEGRDPVRFVADGDGSVAKRCVTPEGLGALRLRKDSGWRFGSAEAWQLAGLLALPQDGGHAAMVARSNEHGAATLSEPASSALEGLWWPRNRISLSVDCSSGNVGYGEPRIASRVRDRQDRQQQTLRAGQPALGNGSPADYESTQYEDARVVGVPAGGMAAMSHDSREEAACGNDAEADSQRGQSARGTTAGTLATPRRMVRVFDILNAGPRHRFTAGGRCVANCYLLLYGGEKDKLFSTMSIERNVDGSLTFPGLKEADIKQWYDSFTRTHPEMRLWQQRVVNGFKNNGCVRSILDFRGRFFKGGFDRNAVINHSIQSSSAALINRSMIEIAHAFPYGSLSPYTGPFAQVHDYIGVQIPEAYAERAKKIVEHAMNVEYGGMPFPSESKPIATNWSKH